MLDAYGRKIEYLRLSVTELCNLRCRYCMPETGIVKKSHQEMLTEEEMIQTVKVCAGLGIRKVRITGGEPLVKKNIISICRGISEISGIDELCITTNGTLLPEYAKPLAEAGVSRVNISLDTLDKERYRQITRCGELDQVLVGIDSALNCGFEKVSINTVLIGDFNDDEKSISELAELTSKYPLDVRFIELMPMLDSDMKYVSSDRVKDILGLKTEVGGSSVCRYYRLEGAKGNIGLISPMSHKFCSECNRIRITADGKVRPCLHSSLEYSIKGKTAAETEEILKQAINSKPASHNLNDNDISEAGRYMNTIGG